MSEPNADTADRQARGRALLARILATREKLESLIPPKQDLRPHKPAHPNPASVNEWKMFHFTSQLVNWFRLSGVFSVLAIVALAWANMLVSDKNIDYLTAPVPIQDAAEKELANNIGQLARLDNLQLFVGTVLPRLKEIHYAQVPDLTPLKGLVSPAILNAEMSYRRGVEQATALNQIVQTLSINARSIENYVFNKTDNRISFNLSGVFRVSANREGRDVVRNVPYKARLILELVPLSAANPFGFVLLKIEQEGAPQ
jgi:hypothetical protein